MVKARVGQWSPDARQSGGCYFAGEGFTGATLKYAAAMSMKAATLAVQQAEIKASIDGGYCDDKPTTIDWSKEGQKANASIKSDNVMSVDSLTIDQGPAGPAYAQSFCCPFVVQNKDGFSPTYVLNKPRIYNLAGVDPSKLHYGRLYCVNGEHLANTFMEPSLFLWDGTTPVDPSKLYNLPITEPGGRGTGRTKDLKRETLFFKIPNSVPAGNYYLIAFTNENRYGISRPKAIPVTVTGMKDPWLTNARTIDLSVVSARLSITEGLKYVTANMSPSEASPVILRLPPGVVTLTGTIKFPSHVGLVGAGMNQTTLMVDPSLDEVTAYTSASYNWAPDDRDLRVISRVGMINLSSNNYFADLTFRLSPDESRQTARSIFVAGPGVDSVRFNQVRFENVLANEKSGGYVDGVIYRFGLHRYWDFRNCEYHCGQVFEGTNGPNEPFRTNGAFDAGLVMGGTFTGVYGGSTASLWGAGIGRGTVIYGVKIANTRRGFAMMPGDFCIESTITCCQLDTGTEFGNLESILTEARNSFVTTPIDATELSVTVSGDTVDRERWIAYVASGTGFGQFRVVKSSAGGRHTLEEPWEIPPDTKSVVMLMLAPANLAYIMNDFRSAGGATFFGNAFGCRVNSNTFDNAIEGVLIDTSWRGSLGQSGDNCQAVAWMSIKSNTFRDGCGIHISAARDSADLTKDAAFPQVAFITLWDNCYRGDVTNQLYACEGQQQNGNEAGPGITSINLIQYVSAMHETSYTTPNYLHKTIARSPLQRAVWFASMEGVGDFVIAGHKIDDVPIKDQGVLVATSAKTKSINDKGYLSLTDLVG